MSDPLTPPPEPLALDALQLRPAEPADLDPAPKPRSGAGLASLVLTLVELVRQLLEAQVVRQMEAGQLSPEQIERAGQSLQALQEQILRLCEVLEIDPADLNVELGDLGSLLPRDGSYYPGQANREGSLLELLDRLISTGIVVDGQVDLGIAQLNLIHLQLKLVLTNRANL